MLATASCPGACDAWLRQSFFFSGTRSRIGLTVAPYDGLKGPLVEMASGNRGPHIDIEDPRCGWPHGACSTSRVSSDRFRACHPRLVLLSVLRSGEDLEFRISLDLDD